MWDLPGNRYLVADVNADMAEGHNVVGTVYVECGAAYRTSGPPHLRPVGETERVVELTAGAQGPVAVGIVGFADLDRGTAVGETLEVHLAAGQGRFRGIRFGTGWDESPMIENTQSARRPGMLGETRIRDGARTLARLDLVLDVWVFHTQLAEVAALADAVPDLRIVLDHCGGPLGYGPYAMNRAEHFTHWRQGLMEVARRPNVVCKLGGLLARGAAYDYRHAPTPPTSIELETVWRPWVETCVEAFGPTRCMFESNFPVDKMGTTYATLWNAFKRLAQGASTDERRWMFAETARHTYHLTC